MISRHALAKRRVSCASRLKLGQSVSTLLCGKGGFKAPTERLAGTRGLLGAIGCTGAGLPATTAPIGRTDDGLLIGVQILGGHLEDQTTIAFAGLIEREFGGFSRPPGF